MKIPLAKLKAMLLFFGTYTDKRILGKTKLMKLFYFTDFGHVKKYGSPITYDTYHHLDRGPTPTVIMDLVTEVGENFEGATLSDTIAIEKREGIFLERVIPAKKFSEEDARYFSETELEVMKSVCKRFEDASTKQIVEASHKEAPWLLTKLPEKIPYTLAAKDPDATVGEEDIKLLLDLTE